MNELFLSVNTYLVPHFNKAFMYVNLFVMHFSWNWLLRIFIIGSKNSFDFGSQYSLSVRSLLKFCHFTVYSDSSSMHHASPYPFLIFF